jgi:hypothetical protein
MPLLAKVLLNLVSRAKHICTIFDFYAIKYILLAEVNFFPEKPATPEENMCVSLSIVFL